MEDILEIVFAIAVLGHGLAHAVATINLGRQIGGTVKDGALTVRSPLLPDLSVRAAAALAMAFWLPATIGFFVAVPAMLDLFLGDLAWSAVLAVAALISSAGIALFAGTWPGGEARLRALHIVLALGMNAIILVTQLVLGWPES